MENHLLPDRGLIISAEAADVYALLNSAPEGLSRAEAAERLVAFGPNVVARYQPYPVWRIALDQIASPIIYVLLVAAGITFALRDYSDAGIILAVVIINALIGNSRLRGRWRRYVSWRPRRPRCVVAARHRRCRGRNWRRGTWHFWRPGCASQLTCGWCVRLICS